MQTKEVNIKGQTYQVVFNLQTLLLFEEIIGYSFFGVEFVKFKERIALTIAAILSANKDADIDYDYIVKNADAETILDITKAYAEVMKLAGKFFKIPEVEPKDDQPADVTDGDEKPKN